MTIARATAFHTFPLPCANSSPPFLPAFQTTPEKCLTIDGWTERDPAAELSIIYFRLGFAWFM